MKFAARKITLKDGRECVLCPTTAKYAEEMIEFLKATAGETPFLLSYPDEVNFTFEDEWEYLTRLYADDRSAMLMALVDGKVVGNSSILGLGGKRRIRHRCSLGIALRKEYWGLGIGTAMIGYLSELAQQIGYEQIELEVLDGNDTAKRLYEKCGFAETGKHIHAVKYDDGTYRDEWLMVKTL